MRSDEIDTNMEEAFLQLEEAGQLALQWMGRNFVRVSPLHSMYCELCKRVSSTKNGSRHHTDDCPIQILEDALEESKQYCQDWR